MHRGKLILAVVIAVVILILIFQNLESVTTEILFVTVTMPRAALLFMTLAAGFVIGLIVALVWERRRKKA